MNDAVPPSAGKTLAVSAGVSNAAVVVLLYVVHKFGINDMTPEVAAAIITLAMGLAGLIMHTQQRLEERKSNAPNPIAPAPAA